MYSVGSAKVWRISLTREFGFMRGKYSRAVWLWRRMYDRPREAPSVCAPSQADAAKMLNLDQRCHGGEKLVRTGHHGTGLHHASGVIVR